MFCRVRYYFLLTLIACLIIWQIYSKYVEELQYGDQPSDAVMLKTIKEHNNRSKVTISVYYEALCPDSRSFFVRHLLPVFLGMESALNVDLIPYGHANTIERGEGRFTFECQHGPSECFGNKLHACAILNIENPKLRMQFVTCLIDDFDDPEKVGFRCAKKLDIQWKLILNCANGVQGDWLLKNYGELTNKLKQPISFVPTVLLNQSILMKECGN